MALNCPLEKVLFSPWEKVNSPLEKVNFPLEKVKLSK